MLMKLVHRHDPKMMALNVPHHSEVVTVTEQDSDQTSTLKSINWGCDGTTVDDPGTMKSTSRPPSR